jgi:hypothetical protein
MDDIAEIERRWPSNRATIDPKDATIVPTELLKRMINCIRECAMEAEIGHEMGNFRVTLLQRYGLTDGTDPAFGPPKYDSLEPVPNPDLF